MDLFFHFRLPHFLRRDLSFHLAFSWVLGSVFGAITSFYASDSLLSLMRMTAVSPVSIVSLLSAILLPLLFSAFAVYISNVWLLIPAAFFKAFLYHFFCFGILRSFGSAGWLIRLLLIFSDTLTLPVLWMYWLRSIKGTREGLAFRTIPAVCAVFLIGSVDYSVISPFLAQILSF